MCQAQLYAMTRTQLNQGQFGVVQRPVCLQVAAILVGIRVPQHDFLDIPARAQMRAINGHLPQLLQDAGARLQILDGLK